MDYFIELAYKQALKSSMNKQYGAVLIYRNKVVGMGYNSSSKITTKNEYCIL
jgi:deoxycytidylate deaminase